MPLPSTSKARRRGFDAWPCVPRRRCPGRGPGKQRRGRAAFPLRAPSRRRRSRRDPNPGSGCSRRRPAGTGPRTRRRRPRSGRCRSSPLPRPQRGPRPGCRSDAPAPSRDRCRCSRGSGTGCRLRRPPCRDWCGSRRAWSQPARPRFATPPALLPVACRQLGRPARSPVHRSAAASSRVRPDPAGHRTGWRSRIRRGAAQVSPPFGLRIGC